MGVITILGIAITLVLGLVLYKKRARKSKSASQPQESDLIDNDLYYNTAEVGAPFLPHQISTLRSQTDSDDALEPSVEPEYLSITNVGQMQQQRSDNTTTFSPETPEDIPEYLSITNVGQQNSDIPINRLHQSADSDTELPDNRNIYFLMKSLQHQNMPTTFDDDNVSMATNPSYIVIYGGMKMTQNNAY